MYIRGRAESGMQDAGFRPVACAELLTRESSVTPRDGPVTGLYHTSCVLVCRGLGNGHTTVPGKGRR